MHGSLNRTLLRAAQRIRIHLFESRTARDLCLPTGAWEELNRVKTLLAVATRRAWHCAVASLLGDFDRQLSILRLRLCDSEQACKAAQVPETISTAKMIYEDLLAIERDFDNFRCDLKARSISASTEPIVLHGIELGRFEITLQWNHIGASTPYHVLALDPNPASSKSEVTHPHVSDESLCEGDGQTPIRKALAQGRLFDFFILVRQILQTYNDDSAYVALASWNGVTCSDCGDCTPPDDACFCESCQSDVCLDCSYSCERCGNTRCSECRASCNGCELTHCFGCLEKCLTCDSDFCRKCLTDGQCTSCQEMETNDELENEQTPATPALTDSAVRSLCMGETVVSS